MAVDTTLSLINFGVNTIFMTISFIILFVFLQKFEGDVQYTKPNIAGLILMTLGLSFHILGNLTAQILVGTPFYEEGFNHAVASFISFSVVMFIVGTFMILFHIIGEDKKSLVKKSGYFFFILGMVDTLYHFIFYFTNEDINIGGIEAGRVEAFYLIVEMIILIIIYLFLYIQSKQTPSKVRANRYQLIAITALGYVLVILVDLLIKLGIFPFGSIISFILFFVLHVITVGALYLLVLFPDWYKGRIGL